MTARLRVGTRGSALALAQARAVAALLRVEVELVVLVTSGDRLAEAQDPAGRPEAEGRGLFVNELASALLRGDVDLCVHSAKDVPPEEAAGLEVVAYPPRADPRDALIGRSLGELPPGAAVATGSARRAAQLLALRPDLRIRPVRGNVDTRMGRVARGEFDAAVLAVAGLERLGRSAEVAEVLQPEQMVPAAGQGALALQVRAEDRRSRDAAAAIGDPITACCVEVERAVLGALGGGCAAPAGVLCVPAGGGLMVSAAVVGGTGGIVRATEVEPHHPVPPHGEGRERILALAHRVVRALLRGGAATFGPAAPGRGDAR